VPSCRNGVEVPFAKKDVIDALQFHRSAILGLEENRVPNFHGSHIRSDRHDLRPIQPAPHLRGCRDDDATARATLTVFASFANEYPIM
jgi:hypothetical protein